MSTPAVEAQIRIEAAADDVYRALTDEAGLRTWFAEHASVDIGQGRYEFSGRFTPGPPQSGATGIRLLRAEPGRELAFAWPIDGGDTVVTASLEPDDDATDLRLVHGSLNKDSAWILECFWSIALENLRAYVERGNAGPRFDFSAVPTGDIDLAVDIDAAPDAVFDALIIPAQLDRYMSGTPAQIDPEPGGRYDIGWGGEGPVRILDLEPGRRLSYSWNSHEQDVGETVVAWEVESIGGRSRLTLVHSGFAPDREGVDYGIGWLDFISRIKQMVEAGDSWRRPSIKVVEDRGIRDAEFYLPPAGIHEAVVSASSRATRQPGQ